MFADSLLKEGPKNVAIPCEGIGTSGQLCRVTLIRNSIISHVGHVFLPPTHKFGNVFILEMQHLRASGPRRISGRFMEKAP
jgi:hypothetical protein